MKRMSRAEALKKAKAILRDGNIITTTHARQMMKKRGFTAQDIEHVINNGMIYKEAEPHIGTGNWIYNIKGKTVDGKALRVVVEIQDNIIVITVI